MRVNTLLWIIICFPTSLLGQKNGIPDVEQFIPKGYNNYINKSHDINTDTYKDYFIIAEPEFTKKGDQPPFQEDNRLFFIWSFNQNRKKYEIWEINCKLLSGHNHNCPLGEVDLDVKDNYFTIRHQYCYGQFFRIDYTTFKFDTKMNKIFLHKVGMSFTDRYDTEKNIPDIVFTQKEFGIVPFSEYESLESLNIHPNYPKPKN